MLVYFEAKMYLCPKCKKLFKMKKFTTLLVLSGLTLGLFSQEYTLSKDSLVNRLASQKRVYTTQRIVAKPKVDGILDDDCWVNEGYWFSDFVQQQPYPAQSPSERSEVKILYDTDNLYVAFKLWDNSVQGFTKTLGRRDDFVDKDIAGLALDTYFDKQTASEFNVTAAGQKVDLQHMGNYNWDTNWNVVWEGKAQVKDSLWTIEMKIPFSQLRYSNDSEQVWGMHIYRYIVRTAEEDQWKLIPMDAPAMVYLFGELRGIKDITRKQNREFMPYTAIKYPVQADRNKDWLTVGLDGKLGLTSNFTLDYSVLPDFGQVEADPSELNLSSFETFYEEKRPFFLEGNSIMSYDTGGSASLFYSRRIGKAPSYHPDIPDNHEMYLPSSSRILNALKVTGKTKNGLSIGVVNGLTMNEYASFYENGASESDDKMLVEPLTNYFVARAKKEYNGGNTFLGFLGTSVLRDLNEEHLKDILPSSATTAGLDFWHSWENRKYYLDLTSYYSKVKGSTDAIVRLQESPVRYYNRIDASHLGVDSSLTSLTGWGGKMSAGKLSGNFRFSGKFMWKTPGLDLNDAGYLQESDAISVSTSLSYIQPKPGKIFLKQRWGFNQSHTWNFGGMDLMDKLRAEGELTFKNTWQFSPAVERVFNMLDTRAMRGGQSLRYDDYSGIELFLNTNASKKFVAGFGGYYYISDNSVNQVYGSVLNLKFKLMDRFTISSNSKFENQKILGQYVSSENNNVAGLIKRLTFFTTLRAELFMTPELSLQFYGSPYSSVGELPELYKVVNGSAWNPDDRYIRLEMVSQNEDTRLMKLVGGSELIEIDQPDFNFQEFRSNLVLRWEYKAGSTLFLVWSHQQSGYESVYIPNVFSSLGKISNLDSSDILMAKFSYWFNI